MKSRRSRRAAYVMITVIGTLYFSGCISDLSDASGPPRVEVRASNWRNASVEVTLEAFDGIDGFWNETLHLVPKPGDANPEVLTRTFKLPGDEVQLYAVSGDGWSGWVNETGIMGKKLVGLSFHTGTTFDVIQ